MRLIDADALIEQIEQNICKPCKERKDDYNGVRCRACQYGDEMDDIEDAPTIEERKKGHWINAECKDGTIAHKCSECKCFVGYSVSSLTWFNFCPWCGAELRGEEE